MRLAIFDFDGTLIEKDSLPCLGREWIRQGRSFPRYLSVWALVLPVYLFYKTGLSSREVMKEKAFRNFNRFYTGLSRQDIQDFFRRAYPFLKEQFSPAVLEELDLARQQGCHCVLLSGSYQELLEIIAQDLGMETVLGAQLAYRDGVFDPRGQIQFIDGRSKLELLQAAFADKPVDWQASRAYGDSYADILILEHVGEKVAVNPDGDLLAHARRNGWRIMSSR